MSFSSNNSNERIPYSRSSFIDIENDLSRRRNSIPNILPELTKIVRKLLPHELSLNIHVRNVDYIEYGCERLSGTLYMTIFRLIFAPDNELRKDNIITSGNRYIGEYDIPLTSIYKINVAPIESKSNFRTFLNDSQIQIETKTFTILTRDFRNITFSKSITKKPNSIITTKPEISLTKMETYIDSLRVHSRFQDKTQLYPHIATQKSAMIIQSSELADDYGFLSPMNPSADDDPTDFCMSNDERIKSYLIHQDWLDELTDANETRWKINTDKFDKNNIVQDEGPFISLSSSNPTDDYKNLIWHWTHTCDLETNSNLDLEQHMLVTITGIDDVRNSSDSRRRSTTESTLNYSCHYTYEHMFQRFNLAKFPCTLKQLELSFEKLVEICTVPLEEDDEKWFTKLNTCRWLRYVSKALQGAASIAKTLNFKNVQLAGSDIDNSCLMSSLIQVFLRPYCRTMKGFCELIIREWIIPGHPFRERFGQVISDTEKYPAQESPIFLLFLDCIYQLLNQNSSLFEFTEYFLIEIYHNVCYCYQHTFAFNSIVERLQAIENYPKNILILSVFDFSLYMDSDICHLLKNHASVFMPKKKVPPPTLPRTRPPPASANKMTKIQNFLEQKLHFNPSRLSSRGGPHKLPSPTIEAATPPPPPPTPPPPTITDVLSVKPEQFKYDNIEAPQKFASDLYVDWRIFNLVLWSKCYCRYDQSYLPTLVEQELSAEISSYRERAEKTSKKSQESTTTDISNSIRYANSWHPQMLVTRI